MGEPTIVLTPLQSGLEVDRDRLVLPPAGVYIVGRKGHCDLVVPDHHAYVSGEHCRLQPGSDIGQVLIEDLSSNGTFINGKRIGQNKSGVARVGDEVSLAKPMRKGGSLRFRLAQGPPVQLREPQISKNEPTPTAPSQQQILLQQQQQQQQQQYQPQHQQHQRHQQHSHQRLGTQ